MTRPASGGPAGTPELRIRLLGGLHLSVEDQLVTTVDAPRLQSLLAYLLVHRDRPQSRERLASVFWPDSEESQARVNLRQALHLLRRALPDADRFLDSEGRSVVWRPDAPCWIDVVEFEQLVARAAAARASDDVQDMLQTAAGLYEGDVLPDCYDDWIVPERERLRDAFLSVAERLAELFELERDYRTAIGWARRLLDHDEVNEAACRRLMRLYALSGDRARALRVYHGCATALVRELGVAPGAATREAYERLIERETVRVPHGRDGAVPARLALVGRSEEWDTLRGAWQQAVAGQSLLAVITGEAGIGKSRLGEELRDWVGRQGYATAGSGCFSAAGSLAYAPVIELLRSHAIGPGLRRLGDGWLAELARLLPELRDEAPELARAPPLIDDWQRARLFDALAHATVAEGRPLLLVIDDLQWCDKETLGWLLYVLRSRPHAPLLLVGTARAEELGPGHAVGSLLLAARAGGQAIELELEPIDRADTVALAAQVWGRELDDEREEVLYRETEGNPLFVVEWVRSGLIDKVSRAGSGEGAGGGWQLPPGPRSVIEARLAQLSPAGQELAGLAATVGRAFTLDVILQASSRSEEEVVEALDELWQRRIVHERDVDAYDFSHDKLREGAYRRAGAARRRLLHRRVAQALERLHGGDLDTVSGQLAAHYERAGWLERSSDFCARAAAVAQRVYAHDEATRLLTRALELLDAQPPGRERDARELALRTALGVALVVLKGYGTQQVTATYARAWELSERLGDPPTAPVVRGVGLSSLTRGELPQAARLGRRLLELGEQDDDAMVRVEGHYLLGVTSFWLGDLGTARDELERAIAAYVPGRARSHLALYSQDPRVVCMIRLAYTLWYLGRSDEACSHSVQALSLAEQLEHPYSLAYALTFASWLALDSGDDGRARELAGRLAGLADERQLGFLRPIGTILGGWARVADGGVDEGITMIREGVDAYHRSGQPLYLPWSLRLLARVCVAAGRLAAAQTALAEAFEVVEATGQRVLEAELHRLAGELALAQGGDRTAVTAHFDRALVIARRQGAVSLEREAAAGLERLRALPA